MTLNTFRTFIQEGDIIGACLPGINSLDVLSDISSKGSLNANLSYVECNYLASGPLIVDKNNLRIQESRILHLFARITSKLLL